MYEAAWEEEQAWGASKRLDRIESNVSNIIKLNDGESQMGLSKSNGIMRIEIVEVVKTAEILKTAEVVKVAKIMRAVEIVEAVKAAG